MAGADEDGADDADAHAADAAHVAAPGLAGLVQLVHELRFRQLIERHVWQRVPPAALAHDRHLLEARTRLDADAVLVAGADALAGAVVDAPRQVGVDLLAVIRRDGRQARAGGGLGALQAILAHLRGDVHERLARQVAVLLDDLPLFPQLLAVVRDSAFLVGDHDLYAVAEDGLLQHRLVRGPIVRPQLHDCQRARPGHAADDFLDVLDVGAVAEHVHLGAGMLLVAGHGGGLVLQDDEGEVLVGLDGIGDGDLAGVEERAVAHEDDLLVGDERVDPAAGAGPEAHAAVVVHELLGGGEHEHRVAAGVAVGHHVHRPAAVVAEHVLRVLEVLADFQQDGGGVAVRATGAEGGRAGDDLFGNHLEDRLARLAQAGHLGGEAAVAKLRRELFGGFNEGDEALGEDGVVQAARVRDAFELLPRRRDGERLAEQAGDDVFRIVQREVVEGGVADVLLEEAATFLDHDHVLAEFGEFVHERHVHRVAHAHLKDGEHAGEAEVGEHVVQVRPGHSGDDEAEGGCRGTGGPPVILFFRV